MSPSSVVRSTLAGVLAALAMQQDWGSLAIALGRAQGHVDAAKERELVQALVELPRHISMLLRSEDQFETLAHSLGKARDVIYLGRGLCYPVALEGALKLKEISYIHAEGYAAGEMKHGPIALITDGVPVIVIAPSDELFQKTDRKSTRLNSSH